MFRLLINKFSVVWFLDEKIDLSVSAQRRITHMHISINFFFQNYSDRVFGYSPMLEKGYGCLDALVTNTTLFLMMMISKQTFYQRIQSGFQLPCERAP